MKQGMGKAYGITFGCYLVLAAVMNILINRMLIGTRWAASSSARSSGSALPRPSG